MTDSSRKFREGFRRGLGNGVAVTDTELAGLMKLAECIAVSGKHLPAFAKGYAKTAQAHPSFDPDDPRYANVTAQGGIGGALGGIGGFFGRLGSRAWGGQAAQDLYTHSRRADQAADTRALREQMAGAQQDQYRMSLPESERQSYDAQQELQGMMTGMKSRFQQALAQQKFLQKDMPAFAKAEYAKTMPTPTPNRTPTPPARIAGDVKATTKPRTKEEREAGAATA